ncbi:aldo/keto reductase [Brevibacillus parabrevis]|uniref:aldo/keto reductase n=1 Tax=Brevibacillus parabrevis TaxID=54914 RepID=UPI0028D6E9D7|nr:aldo/keto reductase [Brevibacillus parabrevis]
MKVYPIKHTELHASSMIMGNMRLTQLSLPDAEKLIRTALEEGINIFDHADIYGQGRCEEHFAEAIQMNPSIRENMILQSKCGIRSKENYYDFSKEHILASVDGILRRLKTEYLDILLLHRPDPLMEPEEVAEAFEQLQTQGKVRHFGVSNHNPAQIQLLQKYIPQKLVVNQIQFSIVHTPLIDSGISLNMKTDQSLNRDSSILEYCRLHDMTMQAWSPFQHGMFDGPFLGDLIRFPELNKVIDNIAEQYEVTNTAVAVAWIARHPAKIQVVLGTTNVQRLKDACKGADLTLTREEWYRIYKAAGNLIP